MNARGRLASLLPAPASRGRGRAHRLFHPLCGARLPVLAAVLARGGAVAPARVPAAAIAVGMAALRFPFTAAEAAWASRALPSPGGYPPPVFIVGHWRSGTSHLANILSRSGAFAILSPMAAGLPAEAAGLGRLARPFVEQFFPAHRLIDDMALRHDLPQEDELAMANLSTLSSQHGIYVPARLLAEFDRALFGAGVGAREERDWARRFERFVAKMTALQGFRPLLIRNPASSARIEALRAIWPAARFIHIHREPAAVYASSVRMFTTLLRELAIGPGGGPADAATLVRHVYPRLLGRLLDDGARLPAAAFAAIPNEELLREPARTLDTVAATLHLPISAAGRAAMLRYAAAEYRPPRRPRLSADDRRFLAAHRTLFARLGYDTGPVVDDVATDSDARPADPGPCAVLA